MIRKVQYLKNDHYKILIYNDKNKLQRVFGEYSSYDAMIQGAQDSEHLFKEEKEQNGYQFTIDDLMEKV